MAVIGSLGSLGLLWPPLLTARTLNWYFMPSTKSGTLASHLFPMTSTAFCHLELQIILKYSECHAALYIKVQVIFKLSASMVLFVIFFIIQYTDNAYYSILIQMTDFQEIH